MSILLSVLIKPKARSTQPCLGIANIFKFDVLINRAEEHSRATFTSVYFVLVKMFDSGSLCCSYMRQSST